MNRSLRFTFLDSWHCVPDQGSGTTVGIAGLSQALELLGHRVEVIRPIRASRRLVDRIRFNLSLANRIDSGDEPDVVIGFDLDGFRWTHRRPRHVPYIVSLKGIAADEARFARSAREGWVLRMLAILERRNASGADQVLVPSRYSREFAVDRYGIPPGKIQVVPEAIDIRTWKALRDRHGDPHAGNRSRPPTVLSVARQYPRKDTRTLLRAMKVVVARHPEVRLIVIGGGPELPRLRRLSRNLDLDGHVSFRGPVARDRDVRAAYFEADLFCLPSRQEGFGIVFVEAMAAGLPVVAARAGATTEVVEHERTGLLVPPSDPEALASALMRLLASPEERRTLGAAGIRAAERYRLEAVGNDLVHRVRPLIEASHQASPVSFAASRSGRRHRCSPHPPTSQRDTAGPGHR